MRKLLPRLWRQWILSQSCHREATRLKHDSEKNGWRKTNKSRIICELPAVVLAVHATARWRFPRRYHVDFTSRPPLRCCGWTSWQRPGGCTGRGPGWRALWVGLWGPLCPLSHPELWAGTPPASPVRSLERGGAEVHRWISVQMLLDELLKDDWNDLQQFTKTT